VCPIQSWNLGLGPSARHDRIANPTTCYVCGAAGATGLLKESIWSAFIGYAC
jgi:hypothetical protein